MQIEGSAGNWLLGGCIVLIGWSSLLWKNLTVLLGDREGIQIYWIFCMSVMNIYTIRFNCSFKQYNVCNNSLSQVLYFIVWRISSHILPSRKLIISLPYEGPGEGGGEQGRSLPLMVRTLQNVRLVYLMGDPGEAKPYRLLQNVRLVYYMGVSRRGKVVLQLVDYNMSG